MDLVSLHKCEDLQEIVGKIQDMNVCVLFQQKVQSWQTVNFGGTSVIKKHYYSWQDIEDMCTNIVKQMYASNYTPDYIVGITRGGNIPATILSNMLNIPCDAVKISLRDDTSPLESNKRMSLDAHKGKNILIVDDINDTGATFNWILQDWNLDLNKHHNVKFATLTENLSSEFGHVRYHVHEVNKAEQDVWLVYPWEKVGRYD